MTPTALPVGDGGDPMEPDRRHVAAASSGRGARDGEASRSPRSIDTPPSTDTEARLDG